MSVEIKLKQGIIKGKQCKTRNNINYLSFEGIPYAEPPLGDLRFKSPIQSGKWRGILDASKPRDKCTQIVFNKQHKYEGSEDCLYLNVYRPITDDGRPIPVMVFVHGGSFLMGAGHYYRPDHFIEKNVILITINYRLSVFGFITFEQPGYTGNAGIKDVAMALRWVRSNVASFGGDERRVCAYGESAGGVALTMLLLKGENLFDSLIIESVTCFLDIMFTRIDNIGLTVKFAETMGHVFTDVENLKCFLINASVDELMMAAYKLDVEGDKFLPRCFLMPVIEVVETEDSILTEDPLLLLRKGFIRKIPMLIGYNGLESAFFIDESKIKFELSSFLPMQYEKNPKITSKVVKILSDSYFNNDSSLVNYINLYSDFLFVRDMHWFIEMYDNPYLWFFRNDYMGSLSFDKVSNLGLSGACHSDQLNYHFPKRSKEHIVLMESDKYIIEFYSRVWSNFAKYKEPRLIDTGLCNFEWLPAGKEKSCLCISNTLSMITNPDIERIETWREIFDIYKNVVKSKL